MEIKEILHMTKGDGEFSYSSNTTTHKSFSRTMKPVLEKVVKSLLQETNVITKLNAVDLGCGVGPALISFIVTVVESVSKIIKEEEVKVVPELQIYMNDLPANDFNLLFTDVGRLKEGLNENGNKVLCFIMGAPGSFYEQLFPCNSLHLVHSYYAIHWLSQVPWGLCNEEGEHMNKGKILATETSVPQVLEAYYDQFQRDFTNLLNCRSNEVVPNGYMALSTICRKSIEPMEPRLMKFLYHALNRLVSKGVIEEEKLDSFDIPIYHPCKEEIEEIVSKQGSFVVESMEVELSEDQNNVENPKQNEHLAKFTRSFSESLISNHFGAHVWNDLYDALCQVILEFLESDSCPSGCVFILIIVLRK